MVINSYKVKAKLSLFLFENDVIKAYGGVDL
jgi:hypothetical protein